VSSTACEPKLSTFLGGLAALVVLYVAVAWAGHAQIRVSSGGEQHEYTLQGDFRRTEEAVRAISTLQKRVRPVNMAQQESQTSIACSNGIPDLWLPPPSPP